MKVQINNIEFRFFNQGSDLLPDKDNLGLAHLTIPGRMTDRFRRECGLTELINNRQIYRMPHYDICDTQNMLKSSEHDCYNSDTQIVLMHWLFNKRRKYRLDYHGLDAFWLFHDSLHAENDVYSFEVDNIRSGLELQRLMEGAEYAYQNGVRITGETLAKLYANWRSRWYFREGERMAKLNVRDFFKYTSKRQANIADRYIEYGTYSNN